MEKNNKETMKILITEEKQADEKRQTDDKNKNMKRKIDDKKSGGKQTPSE